MSEWHELAHFMYNMWYADPIREIRGLTEEQLFWVPDEYNMCILWHVGHIAHRERFHIGRFLQNLEGEIIPPEFEVFGPDWASVEDVRYQSIQCKASSTGSGKSAREVTSSSILLPMMTSTGGREYRKTR